MSNPSSVPLALTHNFFGGDKKCSYLSAQNSCVIGLKGFGGGKKLWRFQPRALILTFKSKVTQNWDSQSLQATQCMKFVKNHTVTSENKLLIFLNHSWPWLEDCVRLTLPDTDRHQAGLIMLFWSLKLIACICWTFTGMSNIRRECPILAGEKELHLEFSFLTSHLLRRLSKPSS